MVAKAPTFRRLRFKCPSCERTMTREVKGNPRTHKSFCEKAGKTVRLQRVK